ncbi:MAG: hypothetical protein CME07_05105 [Gemmatimonadetes bacterium]|nr:hypothetical protein [Gemmatimonadota bacterium]
MQDDSARHEVPEEVRSQRDRLLRENESLGRRIVHNDLERKRTADQVAHLFRITAAVLAAGDLEEQLELVAHGIVTACNYRRCLINLFDDEGRVWKRAHAGLGQEEAAALTEAPLLTPEERARILDERHRIGNSYFVPHDSSLAQDLADTGVSSRRAEDEFLDWHPEDFLFVPLHGMDERLVGTVSVDDPQDGRRPTAGSLTVLELFAREAAFAIEQSTLLRKLEETRSYLNNVVAGSRDAIVTTDVEGRIVLWNAGAERMLGWKQEEISGKSVLTVYEDESSARATMKALRSGQDEDAAEVKETILVSKDGDRIPVSLSASALLDETGRFIGTAGISRDLRPWKKLEKRLLEAEKATTIRELAASLCHETNNFLETILSAGQVSLLTLDRDEICRMYEAAGKESELSAEVDRLTVISQEALKIAALTNRLQHVARGGTYETVEYIHDMKMADLPEGPGLSGRILVADDREYIRRFLKDFLVLEGFQVDTAEDGREAVEMACASHYDVVLSDIKMPHRNGYEVFEQVRAESPDTRVILMTAYGYDPTHSIARASDEGLGAVLFKPFQMARVRAVITEALAAGNDAS